jgi:catechol 2,3-dioxygenase-like lactoylglutathione lyase family enzyme
MVSKEFSMAVVVSNGKKSAKWFEESLGFESSADGHWVLVWPEGSTAKVHLCEGKPDPGNTGIAFYFEDATGQVRHMKEKGVKFTRELKKESWGTNGMFADPDGNEYWIFEGTGP